MMGSIVGWVLALATAGGRATAARAHSLEELQAMLLENEKYFQPIDKPAPEFTLRNADGKVFRLADFRGKVVVLHFIYAGCPTSARFTPTGSPRYTRWSTGRR